VNLSVVGVNYRGIFGSLLVTRHGARTAGRHARLIGKLIRAGPRLPCATSNCARTRSTPRHHFVTGAHWLADHSMKTTRWFGIEQKLTVPAL